MSLTALVNQILVAESLLKTLVGTAIWSPTLPQGFDNSTPAVVFWIESQKQHENASQIAASVSFRCYGGSALPSASESIYVALRDRLQGVVEQNIYGALVSAHESTAQQMPPDPDTGWPVYLAKFQIIAEEF